MSFLKIPNEQRRLLLQLQGFQTNTYLTVVSDLLNIPSFHLPEISFVESDMTALQMPERLRLGNRLERFFSFIIHESEAYELITESLQIIANKVTLGELDFLVFDKEKQEVLHIELAGKLYLYDSKINKELSRWIGPNRKDSLLRKINTLGVKQFPLLYNPVTKKVLSKYNIDTVNTKQCVSYKTRLFMPFNLKDTIPDNVVSENIKGYYITLNEFLTSSFKNYSYFLPEKQDWIVNPKYGEKWFSFSQIIPQLEASLLHKMSPLIWVKKPNHKFETIFVVWW